MLGSITPLGERGRRARWGLTMAALGIGSTLGGAAVGAVLGLLGWGLAPSGRLALVALAGVTAIGVGLDLHLAGRSLPGVRRQVNESWLNRYRSWVYGVGFGLQLGAGMATVVVSSAVYAAFAAAFLAGSPAAGAVIGGGFGLARAATVLPARSIRRPAQLGQLDVRLRSWDRPMRQLTLALQMALVAAGLLLALA